MYTATKLVLHISGSYLNHIQDHMILLHFHCVFIAFTPKLNPNIGKRNSYSACILQTLRIHIQNTLYLWSHLDTGQQHLTVADPTRFRCVPLEHNRISNSLFSLRIFTCPVVWSGHTNNIDSRCGTHNAAVGQNVRFAYTLFSFI